MPYGKILSRSAFASRRRANLTRSTLSLERYPKYATSAQDDPSIGIVGAGPAGLMLGRLLDRSGIPYIIFERDANPQNRQASGTLDVHPNTGQLALREAGLLDDFNALARHGLSTTIVDSKAKHLVSLGGKEDKQRPEIDRRDLQAILQNSVPRNRIKWGSKVTQVDKTQDGGVAITFADQKVASDFRLVVGADGAWSKVRNLYTSDKPQYTGVNFFTTYIRPGDPKYEMTASLAKQGNYLAMDGTEKIFIYALGDKSYFLSVGLQLAEGHNVEEEVLQSPATLWHALLRKPFAMWSSELTSIVQQCNGPLRTWPLYSMSAASLPYKSVRGATLVGDSAHLTVPTGDGVNNALFDSLELARFIVKHGADGLDQAVLDYENSMAIRAVKALEKGVWFKDVLFGAGAPNSFLKAIGVAVNDTETA